MTQRVGSICTKWVTKKQFLFAITCCLIVLTASKGLADDDLATCIKPLLDDYQGEVGVAIKHLERDESFKHRAMVTMPTASLIKFPVMIATYQAIEEGQLELNQTITLKKEDKVPGSGILTPHFSENAKLPLKDAIQLMMAYSDNTATNLVIDRVGLDRTTALMKSLGCPETQLNSKLFRRDTSLDTERSQTYGVGSTTAAEMVLLLEKMKNQTLVSAEASKRMYAHMLACTDHSKLPRLLPAGTKVAHKTGSVSASRCDAGIIESPGGPIAICVLTTNNKDRSWSDDNAANLLCAKIAKEAFGYFNEDDTGTNVDRVLRIGATGLLVEALQRTLNARLDPSPEISIDGDFGPATERTVMAFQRSKQLEETGAVDPKTWTALGTLVEESEMPDPAIVNAKNVEKQPVDTFDGPPYVTCKAWAFCDGKTGKFLWGHDQDERRDIASTTKIMTCYLVTRLAEKQPEILDEIVEFSKRADDTVGSTAGVRVGEKISVRELLFGLMLPSGNDASIALGEHFGARVKSQHLQKEADKDNLTLFIEAMNEAAEDLGMTNTNFENPNGLPQEGHGSCARDLMVLSYEAMRSPLFRSYVNVPLHGCTVTGPGGYKRNLVWRSTNRLLKIEGYDGIKTGTTNAAGSCLVSRGHRGDKSLLLVVLGASSSDARYVDSRNLYRWAWQKPGLTE